jgi:nitrogen regulatory protein PII
MRLLRVAGNISRDAKALRGGARWCSSPMKQIVAIVKPFLVEKILDALRRAPLEALSVMEVKGMGKQKSYLDRYADTEYSLTFLPKVEITVWVDDARVEDVARKIVEVARTGRMGDGKIFILPAQPCEATIDLATAAAKS